MIKSFKLFEENLEETKLEDILIDCKPFINKMKSIFPNKEDFKPLYRGMYNISIEEIKKFNSNKHRQPRDTDIKIHRISDQMFYNKFKWNVRSEGVFVTSRLKKTKIYGKSYIFFPIGDYKYVWSKFVSDFIFNSREIENSIYTYLIDIFNMTYGEGKKGTWYYHNIDTNIKDENEARNEIIKNPRKYTDYPGLIDVKSFKINKTFLRWTPEVSFDDWKSKNKNGEKGKILNEKIKELVNTYIDSDLSKALFIGNEISFKCDSYYLISLDKMDKIKELIYD